MMEKRMKRERNKLFLRILLILLAVWLTVSAVFVAVRLNVEEMKRAAALQKAVTISCGQMFHLEENTIVTIVRTDKPGAPVERHLVMGFSRPLASTGEMTVNAVSVQDFPIATVS